MSQDHRMKNETGEYSPFVKQERKDDGGPVAESLADPATSQACQYRLTEHLRTHTEEAVGPQSVLHGNQEEERSPVTHEPPAGPPVLLQNVKEETEDIPNVEIKLEEDTEDAIGRAEDTFTGIQNETGEYSPFIKQERKDDGGPVAESSADPAISQACVKEETVDIPDVKLEWEEDEEPHIAKESPADPPVLLQNVKEETEDIPNGMQNETGEYGPFLKQERKDDGGPVAESSADPAASQACVKEEILDILDVKLEWEEDYEPPIADESQADPALLVPRVMEGQTPYIKHENEDKDGSQVRGAFSPAGMLNETGKNSPFIKQERKDERGPVAEASADPATSQDCVKEETVDIPDVKLEWEEDEEPPTANESPADPAFFVPRVSEGQTPFIKQENEDQNGIPVGGASSLAGIEIADYLEESGTFSQKHHLVRHKMAQTGEKRFSCEICKKLFSSKRYLALHKRAVHTTEKPFSCVVCSNSFIVKATLVNHMRTHTGDKPFSCNICGKAFSNENILVRHKGTHTNEKPFLCEFCGKLFAQKRYLEQHNLIHMGKTNNCHVCGMAFSNGNLLGRHKGTHTNEKTFLCEFCGKLFAQKRYLEQHNLIHMGKTKNCNVCGKSFTHKHQLKKHIHENSH